MPASRQTQRPTVARTPATTQPTQVKEQKDGQATSDSTASKTVDVSKCQHSYKTDSGRTVTCKLSAHGPEVEHKFRLTGDKSNDMSLREAVGAEFKLDDDDIAPGDEIVQVKEMTRDDDQKWFDEKTKESYDKWVAAGKPAEFNKSPRKRVIVPPTAVAGIRKLLERAGALHDKRVRIAKPVAQEDGNMAIYYVMTDRLPSRKGKGKGSTVTGGSEDD